MWALVMATALAAPNPAMAVHVKGKVTVSDARGSRPLLRFDEIDEGGVITTAEASRVTIRLASGSTLRLGPDTRVALEELQQSGAAAERKEGVRVYVGRLWANVMSLFGDDSSFEVKTENAVAGVRGTSFWVSAGKNDEKFVLEEGELMVRSGNELLNLTKPGAAAGYSQGQLGKLEQLSSNQLAAAREKVGAPKPKLRSSLRTLRQRDSRRRGRNNERRWFTGPHELADSFSTVENQFGDATRAPAARLRIQLELP